jgi:cysteine sulfinate desulfinase/cysteine desulfurase-like protein
MACSRGSSRHSGKSMPSATLVALGRSEELASAALRLALGVETRGGEVEESAEVIASAVLGRQLTRVS